MSDNVQNPAAGSFRSHTPQRDEGLGLHASPSSTEPAELPEPSRRSSAAAPNAFLGVAATLSEPAMDELGAAIHESHGGPGRLRQDGSEFSRETDTEAFAAEEWACQQFNKLPNRTVGENDPGFDFTLTVDVKHLGLKDGKPRRAGNLIINPNAARADRYIVVSGSREEGFRFEGYATVADLTRREPRDFGYGAKLWVPVEELRGRNG